MKILENIAIPAKTYAYIIAGVAVIILATGHVFGSGHPPSNAYECRMQAAKSPTRQGVILAEEACDARFKDEIEREKKK